MKKCLLLALLLLSASVTLLRAQSSLFTVESDTVCVGQPVRIHPTVMNASTYYWGFCSASILNTSPVLDDLGPNFSFSTPTSIVVEKDGDNYYGFVANGGTTELLRLNYGTSLANIPTITNFGSLDTTVTPSPNSLYLTKDSGKYYLFMCGGGGASPSTISRFDFGPHLNGRPNGVRMGNVGGLLNDPRGIFVGKQGSVYYGFVVNAGNNRLIRLNFGNNISRTPTQTLVTPINSGGFGAGLNNPRDITPVYDQGNWYLFVPCAPTGAGTFAGVQRLYFGSSLSNTPVVTYMNTFQGSGMNFFNNVKAPSSVAIIKDCGGWTAFITNTISNPGVGNPQNDSVVKYIFPALTSTTWSFITGYANSKFDVPSDISRIIRDRDSLFAFVTNSGSNGLTRLIFPQCHDATIQSSTAMQPPVFKYDSVGFHTIYLSVDEGMPNMRTDCKTIRVLPVPPLNISHDTLLCQGDTLHIIAASQTAIRYNFRPYYNISDTQGFNVYVYPKIPTTYNVTFIFANGCVVDSPIRVDISTVQADAGPDRTLHDGASTVLGGPNSFTGPQYIYQWFPNTYIDNIFSLNPTVNPPADLTYYLRITNSDRCTAIDTVNVHVTCNDINLPNAFEPDNGRGAPKRFGIINKQLVQLNYFRIFNRWGKLVFETTDVTKEWDGNINGNPAPFGVYVYEADAFCRTGERISKSGNVTLIR